MPPGTCSWEEASGNNLVHGSHVAYCGGSELTLTCFGSSCLQSRKTGIIFSILKAYVFLCLKWKRQGWLHRLQGLVQNENAAPCSKLKNFKLTTANPFSEHKALLRVRPIQQHSHMATKPALGRRYSPLTNA